MSGDAGSAGPDGAPRAAATLCSLYHEAGQQLRRLQDQLAARDALIASLRARLAALEGHTAPSLVDALLEQVARFREQLQRREGGAGEAALRQEIARLKECLQAREREVQQLRGQPQHRQEEEVHLLQRRLEEKDRAQATSRVLCRSLAAETHQLRRTLAATTHMCQRLAVRLAEQQRAHESSEGGLQSQPQPTGGGMSSQSVVEKLQEENRLLKQKVIHVEDLNAKWQHYDASRNEYVKGLRAWLWGLLAPPAPALREETARLDRQLEENTQAWGHAQLEHTHMLEQQIRAYKEDFESGRTEQAQARCQIQELEVACLRCQLSHTEQESCGPGPCQTHPWSSMASFSEAKAPELAASTGRKHEPGSRWLDTSWPSMVQSGQGDLQCPHCLCCFGDEQGEEFLRHVSECCQ